MKLKDYMELRFPGDEITCFDNVVNSEFYFYKKEVGEKPDPNFPNVDKIQDYLIEHLEIHNIGDSGVTVGLYELLENPNVVGFAKEKLYEKNQYGDDNDVVMLLFDGMVKNLSFGYEEFSKKMMECFDGLEQKLTKNEQELLKEVDALLEKHDYTFEDLQKIHEKKKMAVKKEIEMEEPVRYFLEAIEQAYGFGPYSRDEKEAFECYTKKRSECIPGEIVFIREEWEKFQNYLKNEYQNQKKPGVDSLIQNATTKRCEKGTEKEQEKTQGCVRD